jgi:hypothetical protein
MKNKEKASNKSSLKLRTMPSAEPNANRVQARLMHLGAVLAMVLLSGCASASVHDDSDPWQLNATTGYPAVGGPRWSL